MVELKAKVKRGGFTLMETMVATALIGISAIGIMSLLKLQKGTEMTAFNSVELNQARADMLSMLTHPAHCNANFFGATTPSISRTSFNKCNVLTSGSCHSTSIGFSSAYTVNNSSWTSSLIAPRLRLNSLTRSVENITASGISPKVTTGKLIAVFDILQANSVVKQVTLDFVAPVIYDGSSVIGCPNAWGSTDVY